MRRALALGALLACGCVTHTAEAPLGLGSFAVTLVGLDPLASGDLPAGCTEAPDLGTSDCPRPFAAADAPVHVQIRATALDVNGALMPWSGVARVAVRPGRLGSPAGAEIQLEDGDSGVVTFPISLASGPTRLWVEDCGSGAAGASFATGASAAVYFAAPRIDQLNETTDNRTGPLAPRADNGCALAGDPRFGLGRDPEGAIAIVGLPDAAGVSVAPPPNGDTVEIDGCSRAQYEAGACATGPLVVTGVDRGGLWVTDLHPAAVAGFNSLRVATSDYPASIVRGDLLISLAGAPFEDDGTTTLALPTWRRDFVGGGRDLLAAPVRIDPVDYRSGLASNGAPPCAGCTFGDNDRVALGLEALEGALVCIDHLAPATRLEDCDADGSGTIDRRGCAAADCPPVSAADEDACALGTFVPADPGELCCERRCYAAIDCSEATAWAAHGLWVADMYGRYARDPGDAPPLEIGIVTRDADPELDPFAFARTQLETAPQQRRHLRVTGHLRQILSTRPVWVVVARDPDDIGVEEVNGPCP